MTNSIAYNGHCVWPGCFGQAWGYGIPICYQHLDHALRTVAFRVYEETPAEAEIRRLKWAREYRKNKTRTARRENVKRTRRDMPGWVYYISINDMVKIGYTTDITRRMRDYPPASQLIAVHPGTEQLEKMMHHRFRRDLVQGREWFTPSPDLLGHCERVVAQHGDPSQFEYHSPATA